MTPQQIAIAKALGRAALPVASSMKRFAIDMAHRAENSPERPITDKQSEYLLALAFKFRRQMPADLIESEQKLPKWNMLQWLGPEMGRHGLLVNAGWVEQNAIEAETLFAHNQAMRAAACYMACLNRNAIDYIHQAPVVVLALMGSTNFDRPQSRQYLGEKMKALIDKGPKLRDLLAAYDLPVQMRGFTPSALNPKYWMAIHGMRHVKPSILAQSIPPAASMQKLFLSAMTRWSGRTRINTGPDPAPLTEWAVQNLSQQPAVAALVAGDIADFARSPNFNLQWTFVQARVAQERWHADLAKQSSEKQHFSRYGLAWDAPVNYGALPVEFEHKDAKAIALRSGEDIFIEGKAMHHCVASYIPHVVSGNSRLYSIRRGTERIATLEFSNLYVSHVPARAVGAVPRFERGKWRVEQLKGPCNARAPMTAVEIATALLKQINTPRI